MSRRTEKVEALLHKEIGEFLIRLELPSLTTISKVEVSPDLKYCRVGLTMMAEAKVQKQTLKQIMENLSEFQKGLNKKMTMKFVPRISFKIDHGEEYASHINELLRKTHEE